MTATGTDQARESAPRTARMGLLTVGMAIDTLGSGFFAPFVLVYAHLVVGLSLPTAGLCMAVGGIVGLSCGPLAGASLDKYGAATIAVAGNVLAALAGGTLYVARGPGVFIVSCVLGAASSRVFWAAFGPLIGELAPDGQVEQWFGRLRGVRYAGLALGGAAASLAYQVGGTDGLDQMVIADASSFVIAGALTYVATTAIRDGARTRRAAPDAVDMAGALAPGYRTVLKDRGNLLLALLNIGCTLSCAAPLVALPLYALETLGAARWVPGALAAVTTIALALSVLLMHRVTNGRPRLNVLAAANGLWLSGAALFAVAWIAPAWSTALLFVASAVVGAAEAVYAPTADALPLALAPRGLAGRYTAAHQMAWGISGILAPLLAGLLLGLDNAVVWLVFAAIAAVTGLGYQALRAQLDERAGRAGSLTPSETRP
ncbi:MAG: major facilitator transporter [Frankiales bacterium]|nr:major facilitator transporter [Frankiales bacterium]